VLFLNKPAILYLSKRLVRVARFRGSKPEFFEIQWDGVRLDDAFKEIKSQLKISSAKLLLGADVSFTLSIDKPEQLNRADIKKAAQQFIPTDLDDHNFDWRLVEDKLQVVAVSPFLLKAISFAAQQSSITIPYIIPTSVILAQITKPLSEPHLILYSGAETISVIAHHGIAYFASNFESLTPQAITDFIHFASDKYNLKVTRLIHDLPQSSLPKLPPDLKVDSSPLDPLIYLYKANIPTGSDAQILNITPIKNLKPEDMATNKPKSKPPSKSEKQEPKVKEEEKDTSTDQPEVESKDESKASPDSTKKETDASTQPESDTQASPSDDENKPDSSTDTEPAKVDESTQEKLDSVAPADTDTITQSPASSDTPASEPASTTPPDPSTTTLSSTPSESQGFNFKLFFSITLIVILIIGLLGGGFFVAQKALNKPAPIPTPSPTPTTTPTPSPTPTADPVDLTSYSLQVLNGSGIAGEANRVKDILEAEDLVVDDTGNATSYDYTDTIVQLKEDTPDAVYDAIKRALNSEFTLDTQVLDADSDYDAVIIVGQSL